MSWQDEVRAVTKECTVEDLGHLINMACHKYCCMMADCKSDEDLHKMQQIIKIYNLEIQLKKN